MLRLKYEKQKEYDFPDDFPAHIQGEVMIGIPSDISNIPGIPMKKICKNEYHGPAMTCH